MSNKNQSASGAASATATAAHGPAMAALLAHQAAYAEVSARIEKAQAVRADLKQRCDALDVKTARHEDLYPRRHALAARKALGEDVQAELAAVDAEIAKFDVESDKGFEEFDDLDSAMAGLTHRLTEDWALLETMRTQWGLLRARALHEVADQEAQDYVSHAMALQASYRRLLALDMLYRDSTSHLNPLTCRANLEIPSFNLPACEPYQNFHSKLHIVLTRLESQGQLRTSLSKVTEELARIGVQLELPPSPVKVLPGGGEPVAEHGVDD